MLNLIKEHWVKVIPVLVGFLPMLYFYLKAQRRWKKEGAIGEFDVVFQLLSLGDKPIETTLQLADVGSSTFAELYDNSHVAAAVAKACTGKLLDIGDPDGQKRALNPLLKFISAMFREGAFARALRHIPTRTYACVFTLVKTTGGVQAQYRVLIIPEPLLASFAKNGLQDLDVPKYLQFLLPSLEAMVASYKGDQGMFCPLTQLGRVHVTLVDHVAIARQALAATSAALA